MIFIGATSVAASRTAAGRAPSRSPAASSTESACSWPGSPSADELWLLVLGYGVISGFGLGVAYIVPIAMLQKWFPDKRGLITGLAVGGFGFGAVLTAPVANWLIDENLDVPTRASSRSASPTWSCR